MNATTTMRGAPVELFHDEMRTDASPISTVSVFRRSHENFLQAVLEAVETEQL